MTDVWDGNAACLKWETSSKTYLKRETLNSNYSFITQAYRTYLCLLSRSLMSSEEDDILWTHSTDTLIYKGNKTHTQSYCLLILFFMITNKFRTLCKWTWLFFHWKSKGQPMSHRTSWPEERSCYLS